MGWTRGSYVLGGKGRGEAGPSDAGRDEPSGLTARDYPRGLLRGYRPKHLPRERLSRERKQGDRPVVQGLRIGRMGAYREQMDLRIDLSTLITCNQYIYT